MHVTQTAVAVAVALVVALGFLFFGASIFTPFNNSSVIEPAAMENQTPLLSQPIPNPLPETLTVSDVVVGTGKEAVVGSTVSVHYVGAFADGAIFDSSANRGPFSLTIGTGMVIAGWEQGPVGMKEGGKRVLIIPSDLAYGPQGRGIIPPNATLIFEVELISVDES